MMGKYDVFISYRREGGYETAKHLSDLLRRDGYKVSFDIDTLRSGDFDIQLYERIDSCRDFILILDKHSFDRTVIEKNPREKDWLRCELAYALYKNKNVVPIFLTGFTFPNELPNDIVGVIKKNGTEYNRYYFDDFYKTLKKRFLHNQRTIYRKFIAVLIGGLTFLGGLIVLFPILNMGDYSNDVSYGSNRNASQQENESSSVSDSSIILENIETIEGSKHFKDSIAEVKVKKENNQTEGKEIDTNAKQTKAKNETDGNRLETSTKQTNKSSTNSPRQEYGRLLGHDWVDLGLSVKWASQNIGAYSISDYGDYFAWGEVSSKTSYSPDNYTFPQMKDIACSKFDAARVLWGAPWRMPTKKEILELVRCKHEWTSINGIKGCLITGKNGNTIFFPANGSSNYWNKGERGSYWSSTLHDSESSCNMHFDIKNKIFVEAYGSNWGGCAIRPVFK